MSQSSDTFEAKRDLHVGGVGARGSEGLVTSKPVTQSMDYFADISQFLGRQAQAAAQGADAYVRKNPWATVGVVAIVGLTAGYFLSRRAR